MTACTQMELLLSARLDDALTPDETALLEAHLADCPACRALAGQLAELSAAMKLLEEPAPDLLIPQVMARIRPARMPVYWRRWAAMAAVFALVFASSTGMRHWLDSVQTPPAQRIESAPDAQAALSGDMYAGRGQADAQTPVGGAGDAGETGGGERMNITATTKIVSPESATPESAQQKALNGEAGAGTPAPPVLPAPEPAKNDAPMARGSSDSAVTEDAQDTIGSAPMPSAFAAEPFGAEPDALPEAEAESGLLAAAAPRMLRSQGAVLTPAEAEAVLRLYVNDETAAFSFAGTLPNSDFYRFDRTDGGGVYAVSGDGQRIVEKGSPEAGMIETWDVKVE